MSSPPPVRKIPEFTALSVHGTSWSSSSRSFSSSSSFETTPWDHSDDAKLIRPTTHYIFSDDNPDFSPALHQDTAMTTVVIIDFDDSGNNPLSVCSLAGNLQPLSCSVTSTNTAASTLTGDNTPNSKDDLMLTVHMATAQSSSNITSVSTANNNNNNNNQILSTGQHLDQLILAFNQRNNQIRQVINCVDPHN